MSAQPANLVVAYLAQGKIRLKAGAEAPRTIDSVYGNDIRGKAVRAQQKNSWKTAGAGSSFLSGPALWGKSAEGGEVPLAITSICSGKTPGALVYSLESGSLCAMLEVEAFGAEERRLWNDNRTRVRHLSVSHESGDMVFSILHENGTANIGIKLAGSSGIKKLTEADDDLGNLVQAQRAQARGAEEESPDLVPKTWELCRQCPDGQTKILAGGVLAYDVNEQGVIVFTNGNAIYQLSPDGHKQQLVSESMIEQVFFVSNKESARAAD